MQLKGKDRQAVADAIVSHPEISYAELGERFGIAQTTVCTISKEFGLQRPRGSGAPSHPIQKRQVVPELAQSQRGTGFEISEVNRRAMKQFDIAPRNRGPKPTKAEVRNG